MIEFNENGLKVSGDKDQLLSIARMLYNGAIPTEISNLSYKVLLELDEDFRKEVLKATAPPPHEVIETLRKKYPAGTKVRLISMIDPWPVLQGTIGVVELVDDMGGIHCRWENGSGLALYEAIDKFEILNTPWGEK